MCHLVVGLKPDKAFREGGNLFREFILREHLVRHAVRQLAVVVRHTITTDESVCVQTFSAASCFVSQVQVRGFRISVSMSELNVASDYIIVYLHSDASRAIYGSCFIASQYRASWIL